MNGSAQEFSLETNPSQESGVPQCSLKTPIGCVGRGSNGKRRVAMTLCPALPDSGIVFRRTDLGMDIPARLALANDAEPPVVFSRQDVPVIGVKHILMALADRGITNAVVELEGAEVPMVDGAASDFMFLIDCAGRIRQEPPIATTEIPHAA